MTAERRAMKRTAPGVARACERHKGAGSRARRGGEAGQRRSMTEPV